MRKKLLALSLGFFCFAYFSPTAAHAVPITYSFTNTSDFTLGGTAYGGFYRLTLYADTDNVSTSGDLIINPYGVAVLSSFGHVLGTLTDPTQFVYDSTSQTAALIDKFTGDAFLSLFIGPYNGLTYTHATELGVIPLSPFSTSAGQFNITTLGDFSSFEAVPAPEPSTVLLVATGATSLLAGLRRRRSAA
jgi:hypothetical protein